MVTVSFSGLKKYSQEVAEGGVGARGNSQVLDAHGTSEQSGIGNLKTFVMRAAASAAGATAVEAAPPLSVASCRGIVVHAPAITAEAIADCRPEALP